MATSYSDVLIIGAGPSGLFAACELARHGVRARLIERTSAPHRQTRATAIQPATLEALARAGLVETFLDNGVRIRRVRVLGEGCGVLATASLEDIDSTFPFECSLPQWRTEELLAARLSSLGGEVERGLEASSIDVTDDAVVVRATKADGAVERIEARYLIGAGGAHGPTRHAMGEALAGETYPGGYWAADLRIRRSGPVDEARLFVSAAGAALLAPLPEGRFLLIMEIPPSHDPREAPDASQLFLEAGRRIGGDIEFDDLQWVSAFAMHKRMASRMGGKNWFLLGDAAHLSSVFGGEGLNAGLMDAADLAWKLALVMNGSGRRVLLDSYASERSIADRLAVTVSDQIHGNIANLVASFRSGSPPAPAVVDPDEDRAFQRRRCMLDVSYAGSSLIGERRFMEMDWPAGPAPGERYPDRVRLSGVTHQIVAFGDRSAALDAFAARWRGLVEVIYASQAGLSDTKAGVPPGGALLIRPDGFIGFRVDRADAAGVAAIDAHLLTYLMPAGG